MLPELSLHVGLNISLGIMGAAFLLWWQAAQYPQQDVRRWLDVMLLSSLAAIIVGRLVHVWFVNYRYFEAYPADVWKMWYGGLNWQCGLLTGLVVMILATRWRNVAHGPFSDGVALILPLLMLHGWWACRAGGCGYSAILDDHTTSNWVSGYLPDRFGDVWLRHEWQILGMIAALIIWLIIGGLTLEDRLSGRRLGIALILIGGAMLALSFGRDDWLDTRLGDTGTRWFDVIIMAAGFAWLLIPCGHSHSTINPETTVAGA